MTTDSPSSAASPPDAPLNPLRDRRSSHFSAWFQWALCLCAFLLLNIIGCQQYARYDSTRSHVSTLSDTTKKVIAAVDDRTRITVAFVSDSPLREKTWRLARAYSDANPSRVQARLLDPVRDPESAREFSKRHGHEFKDNAVLVTRGKRIIVINESSLTLQRRDHNGDLKTIGFVGEDAITSAMLRLVDPTPPVIYLISGKGPWPATTNGNGYDTLRSLLPRYNAVLKELSLEGLDAIPADAAAVLLANPRYDLSGKEVRLLRDFWETRKGGLFILLNPAYATPNLDSFLKFHGVQPDRRTVLRSLQGSTSNSDELAVAVRFLPGPSLTDSFVNADAKFPGTSAFLRVDSAKDELRTRGIKPFALAESAPGYWGENNADSPPSTFNPSEDEKGPLVIAAGIERAAVEDANVRVPAARIVVFANPHILNPDALQQVNVDFFFSALNWLIDRDSLMGMGPRQPILYQTRLGDRESRMLHVFLLVALPGISLFLAWLAHQRRFS